MVASLSVFWWWVGDNMDSLSFSQLWLSGFSLLCLVPPFSFCPALFPLAFLLAWHFFLLALALLSLGGWPTYIVCQGPMVVTILFLICILVYLGSTTIGFWPSRGTFHGRDLKIWCVLVFICISEFNTGDPEEGSYFSKLVHAVLCFPVAPVYDWGAETSPSACELGSPWSAVFSHCEFSLLTSPFCPVFGFRFYTYLKLTEHTEQSLKTLRRYALLCP